MGNMKFETENYYIKNDTKIGFLQKVLCKNSRLFVLILFIFSLIICSPVYSYEDCIVTTNGRLTDIKIQNNDIIDVFPLITLTNEKNILIVHPLKTGKTRFCVLKNKKDKIFFDVDITKEKTKISDVSGFDILTIDCPKPTQEFFEIELDEPPIEFDLDEPPVFKERNRSD